MKVEDFRIFTIVGIVLVFLLTMMNTCNSCNNSSQFQKINGKIDTLNILIDEFNETVLDAEYARLLIEREGLLTEKSTLLNTNQIFLTKERPDKRVMEIDEQLRVINKKIIDYGN
jgi:hypothetical protein